MDVGSLRLSRAGEEVAFATRSSIVEAFAQGAFPVSYVGHGGIHLWADENVFDVSRVDSLAPQSSWPLLLTMDCLNGYFDFPYLDSLSEALLKVKDKGAIAVFSPAASASTLRRSCIRRCFSASSSRAGVGFSGTSSRPPRPPTWRPAPFPSS